MVEPWKQLKVQKKGYNALNLAFKIQIKLPKISQRINIIGINYFLNSLPKYIEIQFHEWNPMFQFPLHESM